MARGKKNHAPKKGNYKRDNQYIEISDDDTNSDVDELESTPEPVNAKRPAATRSPSTHVEEDFIALDMGEVDTRSRQQRRSEERADLKRKREVENQFEDSWESELCFPWMDLMDTRQLRRISAHKLLQKEVSCFIQYLEPTRIEVKLRQYLVHRIITAIETKLPGAKVHVFGSFSTQLYLPNSDIDMVVVTPPSQPIRLRRLAGILESEEICRDPRLIEHASVPVMKFEDIMTKLKVDIILNSTSGVESANVINNFVKQYPVIRPMSLIIKHLLALRNLNEVFTGGLGGYAIVCLVVSFLQMHPKVASGAIDPMENIGALLLDFFQLYGLNFNMEDVGIDVRGNGSYYRSTAVCRNGRSVFSIRDPQDSNNDIGMKSYNSTSVVRAFKYAYLSMTRKQFALEGELKRNSYKCLDQRTQDNPRLASILSTFLYISTDFIKQRQLFQDVYREKRWTGQSAADTFSFDL